MESGLIRASVQLFFTVLDKFQTDHPEFFKGQTDHLIQLIVKWMEKAHGLNLLPEEDMSELDVRNNNYFDISIRFYRIGVLFFQFPVKIL